jgi:hypothetical protein
MALLSRQARCDHRPARLRRAGHRHRRVPEPARRQSVQGRRLASRHLDQAGRPHRCCTTSISNHVPDRTNCRARSIPGGSVGSYTPGAEAQVIAKDGAGAPVPGGGKLNFQMHYTTTGKASDRPHAGWLLHAESPARVTSSARRSSSTFGLHDPGGRRAPQGNRLRHHAPADMRISTRCIRTPTIAATTSSFCRRRPTARKPCCSVAAEVRLQLAARL